MEKLLIFWQNPWTNPFGKMQIFGVFLIDFSTTQIKLLFVLKYHTTLFIALVFIKTKDGKRLTFLTKAMDKPLWENANFLACFTSKFFIVKLRLFLFYNFSELFLLIHFPLKQKMEKSLVFWQKTWSNPFGKMPILGLF